MELVHYAVMASAGAEGVAAVLNAKGARLVVAGVAGLVSLVLPPSIDLAMMVVEILVARRLS